MKHNLVECQECYEMVEPNEMTTYDGRKMCCYCQEAMFEKDEVDRHWQEESLKYMESGEDE